MIKKQICLYAGYYIDPDTGKQKQHRKKITITAKNITEFRLLESEALIKFQADVDSQSSVINIQSLIKQYYEATPLKPKSISNDLKYIKHFSEAFKKYRLSEINKDVLLAFFNALKKQNLSDYQLHVYYKTLNKYLNFAVDTEILPKNPLRNKLFKAYSSQPKAKKKENIVESYKNLLHIVFSGENPLFTNKFRSMLLLSSDCCLRNSELFGLNWTHINFDKKQVHIKQVAYKLSENVASQIGVDTEVVHTPKTATSDRILPLSELTINYLIKYKAECDDQLNSLGITNNEEIVFYQKPKQNEKTVSRAYGTGFNAKLKRICKYYDIPKLTSHDIRKSANTIRNNLKIPYLVCEHILGHSLGKLNEVYFLRSIDDLREHHKPWENFLNNITVTNEQ